MITKEQAIGALFYVLEHWVRSSNMDCIIAEFEEELTVIEKDVDYGNEVERTVREHVINNDMERQVEQSAWTMVDNALPDVDIPVLVATKNGNYTITKLYQPCDCKGKPIGNITWKGSSTLRDSIVAWIYIPKFKF